MKSAARCDTQSELQNFVSLQILERTLRLLVVQQAHLYQCQFIKSLSPLALLGVRVCGSWTGLAPLWGKSSEMNVEIIFFFCDFQSLFFFQNTPLHLMRLFFFPCGSPPSRKKKASETKRRKLKLTLQNSKLRKVFIDFPQPRVTSTFFLLTFLGCSFWFGRHKNKTKKFRLQKRETFGKVNKEKPFQLTTAELCSASPKSVFQKKLFDLISSETTRLI